MTNHNGDVEYVCESQLKHQKIMMGTTKKIFQQHIIYNLFY